MHSIGMASTPTNKESNPLIHSNLYSLIMGKTILCAIVLLLSITYMRGQCGPGQDTTPPQLTTLSYGSGTQADPYTSIAPEAIGALPSGRYYFSYNGSTFLGEIDNDTDGGGWLLILNYVHQARTNPALQVRNTDLPLSGTSTLGSDESGSTNWGHLGNTLAADLDFEELRFFARTSAHSRVIDFKTSYSNVINYVKTGSGSMSGLHLAANHTVLAGHTANVPTVTLNGFFSNQTDFALTNFPFYVGGNYHWGIRGLGNRWEADDFARNNANTHHQVWARGDLSPIVDTSRAPKITATLDNSGNATVSPADFSALVNATDNCDTPILSLSQTNFTCADVGDNTIQFTASDNSNNRAVVNVIVSVRERVVLSCPAPITADSDSGACGTVVNYTAPTAVGSCGANIATSLVSGLASGSVFPVGTTTNTFEAVDASGRIVHCNLDITVNDTEAPVVNCRDITIQLDAQGQANLDPTTLISPYELDQTGTFAPIDISTSTNTVSLDDDDNSSALPIGFDFNFYGITYSDFYISSNGFISFVGDDDNTAQALPDSSSPNNLIALAWEDLDPSQGGQPAANVIRYQTVGSAPNRILVVEYFEVEHYDGPNEKVTTQAQLYEGSNRIEIHTTNMPGDEDGDEHTMGIENADGTLGLAVPGRNDQDWSATNDFVAFIPTPQNGATDNCGIANYALDITSFDCSHLGTNTVTLTVTDIHGNTTNCESTVTVEDPFAPVVQCKDVTLSLDANGVAHISPEDILVNTNTDYTIDQTGTFAPIDISASGTSVSLTSPGRASSALPIGFDFNFYGITYSDFYISPNGFVTFSDDGNPGCCGGGDILPDASTPNNLIALAWSFLNPRPATSVIRYQTMGSAPNRILVVEYFNLGHFRSGNSFPVTSQLQLFEGSNRIEIHTTNMPSDGSDHTMGIENASGTRALAVPGRNGQDWSATNDFVAFIAPGIAENCGVASTILDVSSFDCSKLGENTVALTVTDTGGNSTVCNAKVTLIDDISPIALCKDITVQLDANGSVTVTGVDLDDGSGDNCGVTLSVTPDTFTCNELGANPVVLTATDPSGNQTSCNATVNVQDNGPIVTTKDITVALDANGQANIVPEDIDNGTSSPCGSLASLVLDISTFDCNNLGDNVVTLTATDDKGKVVSNTAKVTVEDTIRPTVITQDITILLDTNGQASIVPEDIDNGSSDACGIAERSLDISEFNCPTLGPNAVVLTVTDLQGNSTSAIAIVTIGAEDSNLNKVPDSCESLKPVASNGFSPNGDSINDSWTIENLDAFPNHKVMVFNRWGEKVFEAVRYQNDWDGTASRTLGSQRLPVGSYMYVIEFNDTVTPSEHGWLYINY